MTKERDEHMKFSRKEQWIMFGITNGLAVLAIVLFPLYLKYRHMLPISSCIMLEALDLYCPACGVTRAIRTLFDFNILASIKYNPMVFIGAVLFILYEIAMIRHLIKGGDRDCFLKPWMAYAFLIFWMIYAIVRNVLLLYGIDILGNVLG